LFAKCVRYEALSYFFLSFLENSIFDCGTRI
jgi:hypothetical protein